MTIPMRFLAPFLVALSLSASTMPPRLPPWPQEVAAADIIAIGRVERGEGARAELTVHHLLKGAKVTSLTFFCDGGEPLPTGDYLLLLRDVGGRLSLQMAWPADYTEIIKRYEKAIAEMPPWRDLAQGVRVVVVPDDYDGKPEELWLIVRNASGARTYIGDEEWRIEIRSVASGRKWRLTEFSNRIPWQLEPGETHGRRLKDLPELPPGRYEVRAESDSAAAAPFELVVSASPAPPPSASGSAP